MTMKHTKQSIISKDGVSYLIPFILITSCFALWYLPNTIQTLHERRISLGCQHVIFGLQP